MSDCYNLHCFGHHINLLITLTHDLWSPASFWRSLFFFLMTLTLLIGWKKQHFVFFLLTMNEIKAASAHSLKLGRWLLGLLGKIKWNWKKYHCFIRCICMCVFFLIISEVALLSEVVLNFCFKWFAPIILLVCGTSSITHKILVCYLWYYFR